MSAIKRTKTLWDTMKSVSVKSIADEAARGVAVALVGTPEKRAAVLRHLYPTQHAGAENTLVRVFDTTAPADGFPPEPGTFDFIIDAGGGRLLPPERLRIYGVEELGGWERTAERILEQHHDLQLALAQRFPGLRPLVAQHIIRETAQANAQFAMLTALPGVFPILGAILPVGAVGDMLMLTKNQAMMLYRLAAAYGLPLDLRTRSRDLAPLLANAFGWRAIAREIVGGIPGGVGLVMRGTIAYAGTVAIGKALQRLYETGRQPSKAVVNQLYRDALAGAKEAATALAQTLQRRKPAGRRPAASVAEEETLP